MTSATCDRCVAVSVPGNWLETALAADALTFHFPPIAGFVGSDTLAGVIATGLHVSEDLSVLLDLGTNGEIVVGNKDRLLCASTAAGPAFEGGRISCGMRAATGAVCGVNPDGSVEVAGDGAAVGICGSGLVDAVALAIERGEVAPSGRILRADRFLPVTGELRLLQADIRELQLAKAAVASGLEVLLARMGAAPGDIRRLYLAGAFGNYVRAASACRIGLIPFDDSRVVPVGNASLAGAKLLLFSDMGLTDVRTRIEHVPLHADGQFQDAFVAHLPFPPCAN